MYERTAVLQCCAGAFRTQHPPEQMISWTVKQPPPGKHLSTTPCPSSAPPLPPFHPPKSNQHLVVRLAVEDAQNGEEEVENVEVQADGSRDLLLDVVLAQHELRVNQDVAAEDERGNAAVDELARLAGWEEHVHEAEKHQAPERAEEVGHPAGEVVLGLAGKGGQEDEDATGEEDGVEDDGGAVVRDDDGDGVGFEEGEAREEEEVRWVGVALPVGEEHEGDGAEHLERIG
jgi:hypothetical protein